MYRSSGYSVSKVSNEVHYSQRHSNSVVILWIGNLWCYTLTVEVNSSVIAACSLLGSGSWKMLDSACSRCWIRRPQSSWSDATRFNTTTVNTSQPTATKIRRSLCPQVNAVTGWRPCNQYTALVQTTTYVNSTYKSFTHINVTMDGEKIFCRHCN